LFYFSRNFLYFSLYLCGVFISYLIEKISRVLERGGGGGTVYEHSQAVEKSAEY